MKRFVRILLAAGLSLAACGGGGGGPTVSLLFEPPRGAGFADGQINGVPVAPSVRRDFTFSTAVAVSGRVTDATGSPVADVRVSWRLSATALDLDADTTDSLGNYGVTLSEGTWVALVDGGDARGTLTITGLRVAAPGPVVHDFAFPAPQQLSGHVFDSTGAGIDAARVSLSGARTGARATVFCDAGGAYAVMLPPDTYEAVVTPNGPAEATHLKQRFPGIAVSGALVRDFTLVRGVLVSGTVFDDLGLPLLAETEIEVQLHANSAFFAPDRATADGDTGTYSIGPLPRETVTFVVRAPEDLGFPAQRFPRGIVGPLVETEDFTLVRGVVLSGTILRDDGTTPEGDVRVEMVPPQGALAPDNDRTDGSGRYRIALFPGTYEMRITPRPDNLQLPESRIVRITGATILDVVLQRGAVVRGVVRDPSGAPAERIRVEIAGVTGAADTTDGDGQYGFLAPAGMHTLTLAAQDGPFEDIALEPVEDVIVTLPGPVVVDITFSLATAGSSVIHGTVFAPGGASPVPGAVIEARDALGNVAGRTVADALGEYILVLP